VRTHIRRQITREVRVEPGDLDVPIVVLAASRYSSTGQDRPVQVTEVRQTVTRDGGTGGAYDYEVVVRGPKVKTDGRPSIVYGVRVYRDGDDIPADLAPLLLPLPDLLKS